MRVRPTGRWAGFVAALRYAVDGLHYAVRTQRTFRIQLVGAALVALIAIWLRLDADEAALIALAMFAVLAAELLNTGVEAIVDLLVERHQHELARLAKDIAAAAVVAAITGAVIAGALVLGPPLAARLGVAPLWAERLARGGALL
ncbi:MAG TPA: diacylglycerol kinase, partial [bacterium]|nr:diacylglycerol kinase [bacterium]